MVTLYFIRICIYRNRIVSFFSFTQSIMWFLLFIDYMYLIYFVEYDNFKAYIKYILKRFRVSKIFCSQCGITREMYIIFHYVDWMTHCAAWMVFFSFSSLNYFAYALPANYVNEYSLCLDLWLGRVHILRSQNYRFFKIHTLSVIRILLFQYRDNLRILSIGNYIICERFRR